MRMNLGRSVAIIYRFVVFILVLYIAVLKYDRTAKIAHLNATVARPVTNYEWFMKMKAMFRNLGQEDVWLYDNNMPFCKLNTTNFGPIYVDKGPAKLHTVAQMLPELKPGGYYAPLHCQPRHKVAILVPYRNRVKNLAIFMRHMHPFLMQQLLEYRIFVIEQYGTGRFNKGALFNIGFLESQRFGEWHCYIFHDVDLLPKDERILYACPRRPTHMSAAVEAYGYKLPYTRMFGGVTALKTSHFEKVNGYSNLYLDWGAEDDDMFIRLQSRRLSVVRYNQTIARYATLPHEPRPRNYLRHILLALSKKRFRNEGLKSVKYIMMTTNKLKLYTYILADVSPLE